MSIRNFFNINPALSSGLLNEEIIPAFREDDYFNVLFLHFTTETRLRHSIPLYFREKVGYNHDFNASVLELTHDVDLGCLLDEILKFDAVVINPHVSPKFLPLIGALSTHPYAFIFEAKESEAALDYYKDLFALYNNECPLSSWKLILAAMRESKECEFHPYNSPDRRLGKVIDLDLGKAA